MPAAVTDRSAFAASDLMIGAGAAGGGFPGRSLLVMATYVAAQALLVLAYVHPADRPPRT